MSIPKTNSREAIVLSIKGGGLQGYNCTVDENTSKEIKQLLWERTKKNLGVEGAFKNAVEVNWTNNKKEV